MDATDQINLMSNLTSTLDGLRSVIATFLPPANRQVTHAVLLGDVVAECLESKARAGLRPRYLAQLRSSLGQFLQAIGVTTPMAGITARQIEDWLHRDGWTQRTRRNYLTDVRTLFAFAVRRKYLRHNVARDVEKPAPEPQGCGILSLVEIWHVLFTAKTVGLGHYVGVMLFAGIRPEEADRLRPENFRDGCIVLEGNQTKTRRRRVIPILPALAAWLELCGPAQWPPVNRHRKLKAVHKCLPRWPHDALRNCFVSYGLPVYGAAKVSVWAGHTELVLFNSYAEIVTETEALAFWRLSCEVKKDGLGQPVPRVEHRPAHEGAHVVRGLHTLGRFGDEAHLRANEIVR